MPSSELTISQYTPNPPIQLPDGYTTLEVKGYYSNDYIAVDGVTPMMGNFTSGQSGFYYSTTPTINASGDLVVPAHAIQPTVGSNPSARYTEDLFVDGAFFQRLMPNTSVATGWQIPTVYGDPISFDEIAIYNRAATLVYPPNTYFTADQTIQEILRLAGILNYAGLNTLGRTELDTAPDVASVPIAVGANSPVIPSFTLHASKYASFNLAVAAIQALGGGTVVVDAASPVTTNITTLATTQVTFQGQGLLTGSSKTVTFVGPFSAPPKQCWQSGITVSFAGNKVVMFAYAEWWGDTSVADSGPLFNAAATALATMGYGEIRMPSPAYTWTTPVVLGGGVVSTGIGLGGTNGLVGTTITWNGATNATALKLNRGRYNYLHDFRLVNGVAQGTTNGILATGPNVDLQTAHVVVERVTLEGFANGYQAGEVATNSANDETAFRTVRFVGNIRGFYAIANLNSLVFTFESSCVFALNTYGVFASAGFPITVTGCNGGSNDVDFLIDGDRSQLLISGWDGEVSERFIQALNNASVQVNSATLRAYTLARVARTAVIETTGKLSLTNVFHAANFTSAGATGPHFVYATGTGVDITNCYTTDDQLPHIDPTNGGTHGLPYRLYNNHSIDNTTQVVISRFPDGQGQIYWPFMLSGETLLASQGTGDVSSEVDLNTATPTTLFTCPLGRTCIITRVVVKKADVSLTTASYSFGWNSAAFNDVIANATHTELTGPTLYTILLPKIGAKVGAAGDVFKIQVNTLQGGAATCAIDVYGELN